MLGHREQKEGYWRGQEGMMEKNKVGTCYDCVDRLE